MIKIDQVALLPLFHAIWEDGNRKGGSGINDCPESFNDIITDIFGESDSKVKVKLSAEDSSKLSFNPSKCEARTYKEGYGVQCQFVPGKGECLCTRHTNALISIRSKDESLDLPMGRYNSERPNSSLDGKNQKISWVDLRKTTEKQTKKKVTAQKMRDDLTRWGISHIGLKGRKLTDRYNLEVDSREKNSPLSKELTLDSQSRQELTLDSQSRQELTLEVTDKSEDTKQVEDNHTTTPTTDHKDSEESKHVYTDEPKKVSDYKEFFLNHKEIIKKNGIIIENIKGRKQHREKYDEIKKAIGDEKNTSSENEDGVNQSPQLKLEPEMELEPEPEPEIEPEPEPEIEPEIEPEPESEIEPDNQTNSNSHCDDSDTEDLSEEEIEYVETSFDGVDYLEVENDETGICDLYNIQKQKVGKWNDESTNIIWSNDEFRINHEAMIK
jgi:hypothetical protein